jgi:hypothetical protein
MQNIIQAVAQFILFLALCLPAQAQTAARREVDSTTKQSVEFGARGTIQLNKSHMRQSGELNDRRAPQ